MPELTLEEQTAALQELLEGPVVESPRLLPVTPQIQELPFTLLSWKMFEQLCWRLIKGQENVIGQVALYGTQGNDQKGIDIFARLATGAEGTAERWVYQCKNYRYFSPKELTDAITKMEADAEKFVVIFASRASDNHRDIQRQYHNLEVWDGEDLSEKLKGRPDLVADFFGVAWVEPFCEPGAVQRWMLASGRSLHTFEGTVYDGMGNAVVGASVRAIADGESYIGVTGAEGQFSIRLLREVDTVHVIASHQRGDTMLSGVQSIAWRDVTRGDVRVHLRPERMFSARVCWFGGHLPVEKGDLALSVHGTEIKRPPLRNGTFQATLPEGVTCTLSLEAPGAALPLVVNVTPWENAITVFVARACNGWPKEVALIQRICDDCEIEFVRVPPHVREEGGEAQDGAALVVEVGDGPAPVEPAFFIGRFPVTCSDYAFYLQHNPDVTLPAGWTHRIPPGGKQDHPVTGVNWHAAVAYCDWLTGRTGVAHRLPTGAEWLRASGGVDGRRYPWGNDDTDFTRRCNSVEDPINQTTAVNSYPDGRCPHGGWDFVGNVWEWVADEATVPADAPPARFARGGSHIDSRAEVHCGSEAQFAATHCSPQIGFRILREFRGED